MSDPSLHSSLWLTTDTTTTVAAPISTLKLPSLPFYVYIYRTARAGLLVGVGFGVTFIAMALQTLKTDINKSAADTIREYIPRDETEQAYDDYLSAHPTVQALRADPHFVESRPHLRIPTYLRDHNLTAGTLMGPHRVPFPPVAWQDESGDKKEYVQVSYVGDELCGHPGIVHGGYLATALDEGLARCAFAALPNKMGVTANLNINYRAPCMAGQYIVLRGEVVKAEGRKAWVEGRIETLAVGGEKPVILAEATALFIEPKELAVSASLFSAAAVSLSISLTGYRNSSYPNSTQLHHDGFTLLLSRNWGLAGFILSRYRYGIPIS